jgi:hypothetical protein
VSSTAVVGGSISNGVQTCVGTLSASAGKHLMEDEHGYLGPESATGDGRSKHKQSSAADFRNGLRGSIPGDQDLLIAA